MNYSDILRYSLVFEKIASSIFSYASHFGVELGNDKYYHFSRNPITTIRDFVSQVGTTFDISDRRAELQKPKGLWYGIGTSWSKFIGEEDEYYDEDFSSKYLYELTIDKSKIIVIDSDDKLKDFNERFKTEQSITDNGIPIKYVTGINWDLVSQQYCGIEIIITKLSRNVKGYGKGFNFLEPWDVDSGCVWNASCVSLNLKAVRGSDGKWVKQEDAQKISNEKSDQFLIFIWNPQQQVGFDVGKVNAIPSKEELLNIVQKYNKENQMPAGTSILTVEKLEKDIPIKEVSMYRLNVDDKAINLQRVFESWDKTS